MIKKIKKIENLGLFSDYTWDNSLQEFEKFNLFYGWNGSGKSTLAKLFQFLEFGKSDTFPSLKYNIEADTANYKNDEPFNTKIRVFNKDYINKNIQIIKGKANPIFILGEENKKIIEQIDNDEKLLIKLEEDSKRLQYEWEDKKKEKDNKFTDVARIIGATLAGTSKRTYRKPDAEKDFESLKDIHILDEVQLAKQQLIVKQGQKEKISIIKIDIVSILPNLLIEVENICNETVEINVIDRLVKNPNISEWVEKGLLLHNEKSEKCEFCSGLIPQNRIKVLLAHFNDADRKLKDRINILISKLTNMRETIKNILLYNKAQFYEDIQNSFVEESELFNKEKDKLLNNLSLIIETLQLKKQKTTEKVLVSLPQNNLLEAIESVNNVINTHNTRCDNFLKNREDAETIIKNNYLSEIHKDVKKLEEEINNYSVKINNIENGDDSNKDSPCINALKNRINDNKCKILSEHRACESLNKHLQTFLGRKEIFFEVADEGGYIIKRDEVTASNLSEGEQTGIAFIYFIVHLKDQDFDLANGIVVIDDPISSLDSNSLFQAFSFLKNSVKDAKQVFIFTHNFNFLKLLLNWLNYSGNHKYRRYYMIKNKLSNTGDRMAYIAKLDNELEKHESEYNYLFKILYEFDKNRDINDNIASVYHIPNIARKLMETFLMFRVPNEKSFFEKMEELNFDGNKKNAIYKFINNSSHITGDGFDPSLVPESHKNVRYLLEMIETTFPEHYKILKEQFDASLVSG